MSLSILKVRKRVHAQIFFFNKVSFIGLLLSAPLSVIDLIQNYLIKV